MSKKKRYQLIIFDWDGTLVDPHDYIIRCFQEAANEVELKVPENDTIRHIIGLSLETGLRHIYPNITEDDLMLFLANYRRIYQSKVEHDNALFPGVALMLGQLFQQGYMLAVATGKKRKGLDKDLEFFRLQEFFCNTKTIDEAPSKPDPTMIKDLLFEQNISPARALMLGDSEHDIFAAQNAGINVLGVCNGFRNTNYFDSLPCLDVLEKVSDLSKWLKL